MSQSPLPPQTPLFAALWDKQNGCCAICRRAMPARRSAVAHATLWKKYRPTFDHIQAQARGGSEAPENLQLAHARCNKRKGMGEPEQKKSEP